MPKMFPPPKMFFKFLFAHKNKKKTSLKCCQTGPNPAQISIPVP